MCQKYNDDNQNEYDSAKVLSLQNPIIQHNKSMNEAIVINDELRSRCLCDY